MLPRCRAAALPRCRQLACCVGCGRGTSNGHLTGRTGKRRARSGCSGWKAAVLATGLGNLVFEQGDIFRLPFPDASFDLVWSKYVLQ